MIKQEWFCDHCQRAGTCNLPKHATVYQALELLKAAHDQFSNPCRDPKIRVRNPELLSRGQWRNQVRNWRGAA